MGALVAAGDAELGGDAKWLDPRAVPGLTGRSIPLPLSEIDCCCDDNSGRDSGEGGDGDPPPPPPGPRPATAGVAKLAMLEPALVPVPAGSLYAKRRANETRASERANRASTRGSTLSSGVRPKSERLYKVALYSLSTVADPPIFQQPSTTPRAIPMPKLESHHPPVPFLSEEQPLATLQGSRSPSPRSRTGARTNRTVRSQDGRRERAARG